MDKMQAALYTRYGSPDVIKVTEVDKPTPQPNEVLVKIYAASIGAYDVHLLRGQPFFTRFSSGFFKPRNTILGADISGIVESVGGMVQLFKPGDEVYGCLESCGKCGLAAGGFAEYVCAKESVLAPKPTNITFQQAAAIPMSAVTALQAIREKGQVSSGQKVLINGASGGVGPFAVQIAKAFGAEVTGVCSADGMEMVRALGADYIIDYTKEDFTKNEQHYDVMLDIAANRSVADYRKVLNPGGICVVIGFSSISHRLSLAFAGKKEGKRITLLAVDNTNGNDLRFFNTLIESGRVTPTIDSCFSLFEIVQAMHHAETSHPKGKVVITL